MSLTSTEIRLIEKLGSLVADFREVMHDGDPDVIQGDLDEIVFHIHALQRMVGANSAARAHPAKFRTLGRSVLDR